MDTYDMIVAGVATLYPVAIYLLPANIAIKVNVVAKILEAVAKGLRKAEQTKAGLSNRSK